jgi:hypothetical protein
MMSDPNLPPNSPEAPIAPPPGGDDRGGHDPDRDAQRSPAQPGTDSSEDGAAAEHGITES